VGDCGIDDLDREEGVDARGCGGLHGGGVEQAGEGELPLAQDLAEPLAVEVLEPRALDEGDLEVVAEGALHRLGQLLVLPLPDGDALDGLGGAGLEGIDKLADRVVGGAAGQGLGGHDQAQGKMMELGTSHGGISSDWGGGPDTPASYVMAAGGASQDRRIGVGSTLDYKLLHAREGERLG